MSNPALVHVQRVESRAKPMSKAIQRWLMQYARSLLPRVLEQAQREMVTKADDDLTKQLLEILRLYGLRQMQEAAGAAAKWQGGAGKAIIPAGAVKDYLAEKRVLIQQLKADTEESVRRQVGDLINEALQEEPVPSAGEIRRRIMNSWFGPAGGTPGAAEEVGGRGVLGTTEQSTDNGVLYAFSAERADLIARTELAQAENTGKVEGYEQTGAKMLEWVAYTDGKSGDRHHEEMDGKMVKIGDYFVMPRWKGIKDKLRYPGDPSAPIRQTANCRCTVVAHD
jgi:hypothetical protein